MKNLIVPVAIAASGFLMVTSLQSIECNNDGIPSIAKQDLSGHHRHIRNHQTAMPQSEVAVNAITVAHFAPLAEIAVPSFFIDFSDAQAALSDEEISKQMEKDLVVISMPDATSADLEISHQMDENLVEISLPFTEKADAEINENFTSK